MRCQRAQSKDDILSVTISLFHARDVQSLLGVEIGKPTSNASKETEEGRETTYQSALDPKPTNPHLQASHCAHIFIPWRRRETKLAVESGSALSKC